MKRFLAILLGCILFCGSLTAQVTPAPKPTIQGDVELLITESILSKTNWYIIPYGLYAPGLKKKEGGGIAAMYPLSKYVVGGIRLDQFPLDYL